MQNIKLVFPEKKMKDDVLGFKQEFFDAGERTIYGSYKLDTNRYTYDECFEDTAVIAYENGIVSVKVPNTIVKFKLNQCYYESIRKLKKQVTDKSIMFMFV